MKPSKKEKTRMAQSSQKYEIFDWVIGTGLEVAAKFSKDYGYAENCAYGLLVLIRELSMCSVL